GHWRRGTVRPDRKIPVPSAFPGKRRSLDVGLLYPNLKARPVTRSAMESTLSVPSSPSASSAACGPTVVQ
ncbi:MAG TPA: hypothetical protein VN946_11095, partial [Terriglobales bacterium]|nr:hypothetical protein [Terriglobales bacterium]